MEIISLAQRILLEFKHMADFEFFKTISRREFTPPTRGNLIDALIAAGQLPSNIPRTSFIRGNPTTGQYRITTPQFYSGTPPNVGAPITLQGYGWKGLNNPGTPGSTPINPPTKPNNYGVPKYKETSKNHLKMKVV